MVTHYTDRFNHLLRFFKVKDKKSQRYATEVLLTYMYMYKLYNSNSDRLRILITAKHL